MPLLSTVGGCFTGPSVNHIIPLLSKQNLWHTKLEPKCYWRRGLWITFWCLDALASSSTTSELLQACWTFSTPGKPQTQYALELVYVSANFCRPYIWNELFCKLDFWLKPKVGRSFCGGGRERLWGLRRVPCRRHINCQLGKTGGREKSFPDKIHPRHHPLRIQRWPIWVCFVSSQVLFSQFNRLPVICCKFRLVH